MYLKYQLNYAEKLNQLNSWLILLFLSEIFLNLNFVINYLLKI